MRTHQTPWLNRKTWRRLVELHATGRITRAELTRLKERLARPRAGPAAPLVVAPVARIPPRLTLLRGGGAGPASPAPRSPAPREVA